MHIPIGRAQARKCRDDIHAATICHLGGKVLTVTGFGDQVKLIPQPLHHCTADKDASLQRIFHRCACLGCGHGGKQPMAALHRGISRMRQEETACAICIFCLTAAEASLPEESRLLVSCDTRNGNGRSHNVRLSHILAAALDGGQHGAGDIKQAQNVLIPVAGVNIAEHGAGGIRTIGHKGTTFGQLPDEPRIHCSKEKISRLGTLTSARHVIQDPLDLGTRKIRIKTQAGAASDQLCVTRGLQLLADRRGTTTLPDDGVAYGSSRMAIPHNGCLALVGHADGGNFVRVDAGAGDAFGQSGILVSIDGHRIMLDPSRLGIDLGKFMLSHGHKAAGAIKQNSTRGGCTLIQGKQIRLHVSGSLSCILREKTAGKRDCRRCQRRERTSKASSAAAASGRQARV